MLARSKCHLCSHTLMCWSTFPGHQRISSFRLAWWCSKNTNVTWNCSSRPMQHHPGWFWWQSPSTATLPSRKLRSGTQYIQECRCYQPSLTPNCIHISKDTTLNKGETQMYTKLADTVTVAVCRHDSCLMVHSSIWLISVLWLLSWPLSSLQSHRFPHAC